MRESQRSRHSLLMREVNERVFELLGEIGSEDGEFLCECSDKSCIETIPIMRREYAALQETEDCPLLKLPGHPG